MFFKSTPAPEFLKEAWTQNALFLTNEYNELETNAIAIGETDFALGVDFLRKLEDKAKFPFLNGNLYVKKTNQLAFKPFTIHKIHDFKVGIFSVIRSDLNFPSELEAKDPLMAATDIVKTLKPQTDFIIAMTHLGYDLDVQLAQKVENIDFILGGHDGQTLPKPTKVGNTLVFQVGDQGKYMGVLTVSLQKGVHQFHTRQSVELGQLKVSQIDERLKEVREMKKGSMYGTDQSFKDNLDAQEQALLTEKFKLLEDVDLIQKQGSFYHHKVVALDEEQFNKGEAKTFSRVQAFKEKLKGVHEKQEKESTVTKAVQTNQNHTLEYGTYQTCVQCHQTQYDVWKVSKHATAMIPLYIRNQHKNPECVKCHSVGLQEPGGFTQVSNPFLKKDGTQEALETFLEKLVQTTEIPKDVKAEMEKNPKIKDAIQKKNIKGLMVELRELPAFDAWLRKRYIEAMEKSKWKKDFMGVQCENCHGARGLKDLAQKPVPHFSKSGLFSKKVSQSACLTCHTQAQDPTFDFHKDRNIKGEKSVIETEKTPFNCALGVF